ncbi:transglycosylase SLT domain-containing protein [Billgrantia gudaonensis]|uniref:Membrane-bound lytic murein transglycosylase D n=1 Tax=Billgrantia gudaonensis TaxID=376427 RepID=A0A1G8WPN0_9GAMM|nr:transglycosylase SLT domain-containing protein [Halomonas gudaonensis]SDJ80056.1 membrane-bound lytic murein transglycosylase D [Halomonas gudaonensis]
MIHRTARRQTIGLVASFALTGTLALATTTSQATTIPPHSGAPASHSFWEVLQLEPRASDAWEQLRGLMQWDHHTEDPRVRRWIEHYRASPHNVREITERARPWLAWINAQLQQRDLPGEIALVPFIESSFDPQARSHRGAAGMWQFMPGTADALGLLRQQGYDGRLDVAASTRAALDYIELQAEQWYDGDIELSLAAYNAGAGTVNRARNAALSRGERGDYWNLDLPGETMQYLPKLHALAAIIADPEAHDIELPAIDVTPAIAEVPVEQTIDIARLADMAGLRQSELTALNPGLTGGQVHPGTADVVLVPSEHETVIQARLNDATPRRSTDGGTAEYVVQQGDTLSRIASQHGISVDELRRYNGLQGDIIQVGQSLDMPAQSLASR